MQTIYIDKEFKCFVDAKKGLEPVETSAFDGKCDAYIEGCRYIPEGRTWTRQDGAVFKGEMISPFASYAKMDAAQREEEHEALKLLGGIGEAAPIKQAAEVRAAVAAALASADNETAMTLSVFIDEWKTGQHYDIGGCVTLNGLFFRCLTSHTSQADWTPGTAPSLWVRIDNPTDEWPEWRQPEGAHDAYRIDDRVSYEGKHWICVTDFNVWPPGEGWREVTIND